MIDGDAEEEAGAGEIDRGTFSEYDVRKFNETKTALEARSTGLFTLKLKQRLHEYSGQSNTAQVLKLRAQEEDLVKATIRDYDINQFAPDFEELSRQHPNKDKLTEVILDKYGYLLQILKDFYFEYAQILYDVADEKLYKTGNKGIKTKKGEHPVNVEDEDPAKVLKEDKFVEAFFYMYTSAILGHPRARMQYSTYYLQNALLPTKSVLKYALDGKVDEIRGRFSYLKYVSPDLDKFLTQDKMTDV